MMKCQELLPCSRTQWMHADPWREQFCRNRGLFCDLGGNIENVVDGQEKGCSRKDILAVICCYTGEKKVWTDKIDDNLSRDSNLILASMSFWAN